MDPTYQFLKKHKKHTIEIVDLPMKHGGSFHRFFLGLFTRASRERSGPVLILVPIIPWGPWSPWVGATCGASRLRLVFGFGCV